MVGTVGWAVWRVRMAPRVHLPEGTLDERPPEEPLNLLLVGSDSRAPAADDAGAPGTAPAPLLDACA